MPASFAQHHGSIPLGRAALVLAAALVALGGMPPELFADDRIEYVGTYNPNFFAELQDVELANGRAYIFGVGGFGIMNIDDPAAPTLIGRYEPPGHPYVRYYRGAVGAKYAYGGGREDQVAIIDMTVESNPTNVTTYGDRHMSYEGLELDGDILYACRHNGGLELIDVSMPFAPVTLSELTSLTNSWDLALSGSYAFVADGVGGLAVVDIGDSNSPQHLYSLPTSGSAVDVDLDGNLALVACGSAGVEIFDIGDPLNAFWVGNYNSSGLAITLDATGGKVFVADWDDIEVIDLSVPESPSRLAWENTPVRAMGLAAAGDRVYVADWSRFKIYDFGDTGADKIPGYGCMQVHNWQSKQTVFAFNRFDGTADLGIGNSTGKSRDWTFTANAGSYTLRRLTVFVK
jgi:hypothetical protein